MKKNKNDFPKATQFFDWMSIILAGGGVAGMLIDGYSHTHNTGVESFITPWHAVLYGSFFAAGIFYSIQFIKNYRKGYAFTHCLPKEYQGTMIGLPLFFFSGLADMTWHHFFGFEQRLDAILSPTHMILGASAIYLISGPLHAIWHRDQKQSKIHPIPTIVSFTYVFMVLAWFLQYVNPFDYPWLLNGYSPDINYFFPQALNLGSLIIYTVLFMGMLLTTLRHWKIPFGGLTFAIVFNVLGITLMHAQFQWFAIIVFPGAVAVDLLYTKLYPRLHREGYLRLLGFLAPVILFACYMTAATVIGTSWTIHALLGSVVVTGIVGYFMTFVLAPPGKVNQITID